MTQKLSYLRRIVILMMLAAVVLSGCEFSAAPRPTAVPQEVPAVQGASPSEADLYATAIASLGGQLTQTAVVADLEIPAEEDHLPQGQGEVIPEHGEEALPAEGAHGTEAAPHGAEDFPTASYGIPSMGGTPTPHGMTGPTGYDSNYNPNLDPNYNANTTYGSTSSYGGAYQYGNQPYYPYAQGTGTTSYIVQVGDWLYSIARRFGVSPDAIIAANPGILPNRLYPGQVLVIPNPMYGAAGQTGQMQWYPRYVSTSVWYPEYYWSYGYNPSWYPDWYQSYGSSAAAPSYLPSDYYKYGPENWGTIPQYEICSTGRAQSPINLDASKITMGGPQNVRFHYRPADVRLVSSDFTFQVEVPSGSYMEVDGVAYELMNVTFHMPSEHTVNGKPYYMEIQLVHFNANTGKYAIASVFVNEGGQDNAALAPIWFNMPQPPYNTAEVKNFDPGVFIPMDPKMYSYTGSITTPPCTEGINWMVFAAPIELSRTQIERYRSMFPYNARPVQDLNDRSVYGTP